ncbi:LOW QUALITY PROTEIN: hypothetical protein PanWU01x14_164880 [Parasponia andersonii]|uniref:Uncharacterized protein n=1 Tax=Parasponia andersonii TaxID=3476 RepID=A0A2P5CCH9_PARAD|nr:LOW QUALITY PROTEIN: hypothetical protein PanWU01x14_164880 [Parasponia andersonii]
MPNALQWINTKGTFMRNYRACGVTSTDL